MSELTVATTVVLCSKGLVNPKTALYYNLVKLLSPLGQGTNSVYVLNVRCQYDSSISQALRKRLDELTKAVLIPDDDEHKVIALAVQTVDAFLDDARHIWEDVKK